MHIVNAQAMLYLNIGFVSWTSRYQHHASVIPITMHIVDAHAMLYLNVGFFSWTNRYQHHASVIVITVTTHIMSAQSPIWAMAYGHSYVLPP